MPSIELSPLEKLGDAIQEFFRATGMREDTHVTCWALAVGSARLQMDNPDALPMVDGSWYALGPETSVIQAAGLAQYLRVVTERAQWQTVGDD